MPWLAAIAPSLIGAGGMIGAASMSGGGGGSDPSFQTIKPYMGGSQETVLQQLLSALATQADTYEGKTIDNSAEIRELAVRLNEYNDRIDKGTAGSTSYINAVEKKSRVKKQIAALQKEQNESGTWTPGRESLFTRPGEVPDFPLTAGTQPLTQQMQNLAGGTTPLAAQGFAQGMQNLNQPGMGMDDFTRQVGDPLAEWQQNQFMNRAVPDITNRFASVDSARSSGMFDALAREAGNLNLGMNAQMAPMAFGAAENDRTRMLQAAQTQTQAGMSGLGFGQGVAGQQQALAQADVAGNLQKFQMGLPGGDPRLALLGTAFTGVSGGGTVGIPGSYTPSTASQIMPSIASMYGSYVGSQKQQQIQTPQQPGWQYQANQDDASMYGGLVRTDRYGNDYY